MRGYKHVAAEFADRFATGESIQIGTFESYRSGEGDRVDQSEGSASNVITEYRSAPGQLPTPDEHRRLRAVGFDVRGTGVTIIGAKHIMLLRPRYLFCCSSEPDFTRVKLGEVVFEISDLELFGHRLTRAHPVLFGAGFACGPVTYAPRRADVLKDEPVRPDPFLKDPQFETEKELRIVWDVVQVGAPREVIVSHRAAKLIKRLTPPA